MKKYIAGGVVLLMVIGAASGGSKSHQSTTSTTTGSDAASTSTNAVKSASAAPVKAKNKPKSCGFKATDDCTPHLGASHKVRVDALVWNIKSVRMAKTLGDTTYGLGEKADGEYVIVKLGVTSKRDESATLTDDVMHLQIGDKTYSADTDGTVAAMGAGQQPFWFDDISPDSTTSGTVVFDVPTSKLGRKMEMKFTELGFGSTKGYIRLPQLTA
jgi:hypothetical protein